MGSSVISTHEQPLETGKTDWAEIHGIAAIILLLVIATAILYLPCVGIPFFGDDYIYRFENPHEAVYRYFITYNDLNGIFRPIQMTWCAINQYLFGEDTRVLQAVQVGIHACIAILLFLFMKWNGISKTASLPALLLFVANPAAVSGVLGNDTFSQIGCTLCGIVSVMMLWPYRSKAETSEGTQSHDPFPCGWKAAFSVLAFLLALLCKEAALSLIGILFAVVLYILWLRRKAGIRNAPYKPILLLGLYILTMGLYYAYRKQMAPTLFVIGRSGDYDIWFGRNIFTNQLALYVCSLLPVSTVDVFMAYARRDMTVLLGCGLLIAVWYGMLLLGLVRAKSWRLAAGLLFASSCSIATVSIMNHVSELYTYNMLPYMTILVSLSLSALLENKRTSFIRIVTVCILAIVLTGSVTAVRHKAAQMRSNGEAAARLETQVVDLAKTLPTNGRILLVEKSSAGQHYYSVFITSDFQGLIAAEHWIRHMSHRPDLSIKIVDENHLKPADLVLVRSDDDGHTNVRVHTSSPASNRSVK